MVADAKRDSRMISSSDRDVPTESTAGFIHVLFPHEMLKGASLAGTCY
jgi:hypothetical protein